MRCTGPERCTLKVATYNVNGINARLPVLLRWLEMDAPEIVCLQELKAPQARFPLAALQAAGYEAIWHGARRGLANRSCVAEPFVAGLACHRGRQPRRARLADDQRPRTGLARACAMSDEEMMPTLGLHRSGQKQSIASRIESSVAMLAADPGWIMDASHCVFNVSQPLRWYVCCRSVQAPRASQLGRLARQCVRCL